MGPVGRRSNNNMISFLWEVEIGGKQSLLTLFCRPVSPPTLAPARRSSRC